MSPRQPFGTSVTAPTLPTAALAVFKAIASALAPASTALGLRFSTAGGMIVGVSGRKLVMPVSRSPDSTSCLRAEDAQEPARREAIEPELDRRARFPRIVHPDGLPLAA
jgi:hypothetical protein